MSVALYSGVSGLALGSGLYRDVSGLWGGASGLIDGFGGTFSPASLFAASEPGGWYDPSDLSTLFQDSAGTTPVTAPGQTVGLWLDKSQGLALGAELVTNGDFSQGSTGWTLGSGWSVSGGQLVATSVAFGVEAKQAIGSLVSGARYVVTFTVTVTSGTLKVNLGDLGVSATELLVSTSGTYTYRPARSGAAQITFWAATTFTGTIDNISVRELPGNHLSQSTLSNRAIYGIEPFGGRRNLLTYTEQFDNAAWVKTNVTVTANAAVAPDGTTTADTLVPNTTNTAHFLSLSLSGLSVTAHTFTLRAKPAGYDWITLFLYDGTFGNRFANFHLSGAGSTGNSQGMASTGISGPDAEGFYTITATTTAPAAAISIARIYAANGDTTGTNLPSFAGDGTSGILIWGAQLEVGSTATAYQRVVTAFDVTQAGVPSLSYIQFDGSDDSYVSPTITPGTDKAQVFAGVRYQTLSTTSVMAELSASFSSNNGTFIFYGENNSRPAFASKGTFSSDWVYSSVVTAPVTLVQTGLGDISGDRATIRVDGTQTGQSTIDQGTGNYLAYPLYVGRRGGTTFPFNGRIYSLIVRFGANLSASTITQTENWVAGKTGIYTLDQLNRLNAQTADGTLYSAYAASDANSNNYLVNNTVLAADGTSYNVI